QNTAGGVGSGSPVNSSTAARNTIANGKPNRKRTCVAPTVPSTAVSSRCMALRAVWPAAASSVKGIQRMPVSTEVVQSPRSGGFQHAGLAVGRPFGDAAVLVVDQKEQVKIADCRIAAGA